MMRMAPRLGNGMITGMLRKAICHVNILTWPRGFQDKHPYLVLSSLYPVSFGRERRRLMIGCYADFLSRFQVMDENSDQ